MRRGQRLKFRVFRQACCLPEECRATPWVVFDPWRRTYEFFASWREAMRFTEGMAE